MASLEIGPYFNEKKTWLVTGCAGFIGSHLVEYLISNNQNVVGLDNLSTGFKDHLKLFDPKKFKFIEGDIRSRATCEEAVKGCDIILHQAALNSMTRSLKEPENVHENNVTGFVNLYFSALHAGVEKFIYASSSSVYGDESSTEKKESRVGNILSPYAATKKMNELYAYAYSQHYRLKPVGLRYFNVFGERQNPFSEYSAVIPKWITKFMKKETIEIFGDGETSRDFTYVKNICELNARAAFFSTTSDVYNGAAGKTTTLNTLFSLIKEELLKFDPSVKEMTAQYKDFRKGDIRSSLANLEHVKAQLGYHPQISVAEGLMPTVEYYWRNAQSWEKH